MKKILPIAFVSLLCFLCILTLFSFTSLKNAEKKPEKCSYAKQMPLHSCDQSHELKIKLLKNAAEHEKARQEKAKALEEEKEKKILEEKRILQEAKEAEELKRKIILPLTYPNWYITSPFAEVAELRGYEPHRGLDFGVDLRSDQLAVASTEGIVVFSGDASTTPFSGCGNMVSVWSEVHQVMTSYCHLSETLVNEGQTILPGDALGVIGTTGLSNGIHLHFMVGYSRDIFDIMSLVDPEEWLKNAGII